MNLPQLDGADIASLVSLLLVLIFWVMVLRNKRAADDELNRKLVERQDRIDAERARQSVETKPVPTTPPSDHKTGPWG